MANYVRYRGKLELMLTPSSPSSVYEEIELFLLKKHSTYDINFYNLETYCKEYKLDGLNYVILDDRLYMIEEKEIGIVNSGDYFTIIIGIDNVIEFDTVFYDGGRTLAGVLEDCITNENLKEKIKCVTYDI